MDITPRTAVTTSTTTATTSVKLNKPSGVAVNDILIASFSLNGSTITGEPAGWIEIGEAVFSNPGVYLYYKRAVSSDTTATSYTWTLNAAMAYGGFMQAFSGVDTTTAMDVAAKTLVDVDSTTTSFSISMTTVTPGAVLVSALGANTTSSVDATAPSGWTRDPVGTVAFTAGKANALAHFTKTTAGAGTYTWTISSGRAGGMVLGALRPTASVPTALDPPDLTEADVLGAVVRTSGLLGSAAMVESDTLSAVLTPDAKITSAPIVGVDTVSVSLASAMVLAAAIVGVDTLAAGLSSWATITPRTALTATADTASATTALTMPKPAGADVDDVLVASFSTLAANVSAVPTGWSLVGAITAGNPFLFLYWRRLTAGDASVTSWTWTMSTAAAWGGVIQAFVNVDTVTALDATGVTMSDASSSATSFPISITTSTPNAMLVSTLGANTGGSVTPTPPSSWTRDPADATTFTSNRANAMAHYARSVPGAGTYTWTIDSGRSGAAVITALRPRVILSVAVAGQFAQSDTLSAALVSRTALAGSLGEADTLSAVLQPSVALSAALVESDGLAATINTGTPLTAQLFEASVLSVVLSTPMLLVARIDGFDTLDGWPMSPTSLSAAMVSGDVLHVRLWMFAPRNLAILTATAPVKHWSGTAPQSALVGSEPTR